MSETYLEPTRERLKKSTEWETPTSDRKTKRLHHRPIGVIEGMKRRGWISDAQSLAFEAYEKAYLTSTRAPGTTLRYGASTGSSDSELDPLDRKITATARLEAWDVAIGFPAGTKALRQCSTEDTALEKIGRTVCGEGNKVQAITAAKHTIQMALYRLAKHMAILQHFHPPSG